MIRFGYFGQFFHGLQPQSNVPTAGAALLEHIIQAAGQKPKALCFAARTDKGVHALENIATFWFPPGPFDVEQFLTRLHQIQTPGLRDIRGTQVGVKVHARGNARGKHYRYVLNGPDPTTSWQIVPELNLKSMQEALNYVRGTHDFQSLRASGCTAGSSMKTIDEVSINSDLHVNIHGDAFLRQMIRILVGLLVEIGTGLRKPEEMKTILDAKDRKMAGITAPPEGLTLVKVDFQPVSV